MKPKETTQVNSRNTDIVGMPTNHLYRFATLKSTGETVRLEFFSSLTDTYSVSLIGDSFSSLEISINNLSNFIK